MFYSSTDTSQEEVEDTRSNGLNARMGQSASRPKKQPAAPAPEEEQEGWGLFHSGQATSVPEGTDSQQMHEENLPSADTASRNTEDISGEDETQQDPAARGDGASTHEDEHQKQSPASHVTDPAHDEQDDRSDGRDDEPNRPVEMSANGQNPDPDPISSGEETADTQTPEPHENMAERETSNQGKDQTKEPKITESVPKPTLQANVGAHTATNSADRAPYTWFDMVIDLDDPKPLGPAGYFCGPSTMPELPPLGPKTSIHVL
ncbi:hypothetical protein FOPE_00422 [Fonsecaea pedrosoi]|nr:hypothetical protein FOPE_00422 [Fonsecaea pedrosoi]